MASNKCEETKVGFDRHKLPIHALSQVCAALRSPRSTSALAEMCRIRQYGEMYISLASLLLLCTSLRCREQGHE